MNSYVIFGASGGIGSAHLTSELDWEQTIATNLASAIEWLLDPEQSWVTGQVIGVDGGLGTSRAR